MTVNFKPSKPEGEIALPYSKSESHRAIICASLAGGTVKNINFCSDVKATLSCLKTLGADFKICGNNITFNAFNPFEIKDSKVYCNQSGSTVRFLIPLCLLSGAKVTFFGEKSLFARPFSVYIKLFEENGIEYELKENSLTVCGKLKGNIINLDGGISSQFVSGMLFVLPFLKAKLSVNGEIPSAPYVELTKYVLSKFGISINESGSVFSSCGNFEKCEYTVSADITAAAYIDAFSVLGGKIKLLSINENCVQGDKIYKEFFKKMKNREKEFCLENNPDLAPVMFSLAAFLGGKYVFSGCERLKYKECNRIESMKSVLSGFGVNLSYSSGKVTVNSNGIKKPLKSVECFGDHRTVMAASLLAAKTGGSISGAECVIKSFPQFFGELEKSGVLFDIS